MINAGAIATTGLVDGHTSQQKVRRIPDTFSWYAGRPLEIDSSVYKSESETGHRNRAIAHMLRNFEIFQDDPIPSLEAYFQQCSILVNCLDLAFMGATLANNGIHPVTGQRAVVADYVQNILSVMASCGMYDGAGEWPYNVGMPAKSGVAGGIVAVLPSQLAVAVFSPPLDERGNSVRGIAVCRELSAAYQLHLFNTAKPGMAVIRGRTTAAQISSNRSRPASEMALLARHGGAIQIIEIQSDVTFGAVERVVREMIDLVPGTASFVLDLSRVSGIDQVSCRLLLDTFDQLTSRGIWVHVTRSHHLPILARSARKRYGKSPPDKLRWNEDSDIALEFSENRLLDSLGDLLSSQAGLALDSCELVENLTPDELDILRPLLKPKSFTPDSVVFEAGETADELLVILRGKASINLVLGSGVAYRVTTCTPGLTFVEMALIDQSTRSATVRADTAIDALSLSRENFQDLALSQPVIYSKLLASIASHLASRLRKRNAEVINSHI
jgi:glutaminase